MAQLKVHSKFDDRNEDGTFADQAAFKNTLGELLKAEQEVFQAALEYGHDEVGNRAYERFTKASTHSKDYTYYQNSNRLLSDGEYAFVYDDDGNLIRKGNRFTLAGEQVSFTTEGRGVEYWEYSYNLRNQLSQVRKNGQLVATYVYDGLGLRVSASTTITSKTTGQSKATTRDYVFDLADRVIYDKAIFSAGMLPSNEDPETSTENSYVFANGTHFAKVEGPIGTTAEVYYYHNDHLGSPMAITDKDGNLAWSQDYLPYGEALNEAATAKKTRFTFTGKELDPATGLMYYNARWYDPDLGRFMTEDTYAGDPNRPQTMNRYSYVLDNPLRYADPTGHWTVGIGASAAAAFVGRIGVTGLIVVDDQGDVGVLIGGSMGGGTPVLGAGGTLSITNADSILDLKNLSGEGGGSLGGMVPGMPSVGAEAVIGEGWQGVNVSASGVEVKPVAEGHGELSYSKVIPIDGELADEIRELVLEKVEKILEALPDKVKETIEDRLGEDMSDILDKVREHDDDAREKELVLEEGEEDS